MFRFVSVKDSLVKCRFLRRTEYCGHQKIDVGIMTHPKLLKLMGAHKMYPRRKTVEIMFHLIPDGCKIVFKLENKNIVFDFFNKMV